MARSYCQEGRRVRGALGAVLDRDDAGRPPKVQRLVALSEIDRNLLQRCLAGKPRAWKDFVDRFMGLVIHVINHTAECRSLRLSKEDREDLCGEVFLAMVRDDFAVLRRFRGESSLATYLTVVARRVAVHQMVGRRPATMAPLSELGGLAVDTTPPAEQRITDNDEAQRLINVLEGNERDVARMYHMEGMSYREIGRALGLAENSIGPTLSRARGKMRQARPDPTTG